MVSGRVQTIFPDGQTIFPRTIAFSLSLPEADAHIKEKYSLHQKSFVL
jgi:hypothetical protein